jgi:hypothetical protein
MRYSYETTNWATRYGTRVTGFAVIDSQRRRDEPIAQCTDRDDVEKIVEALNAQIERTKARNDA